MGAEVFPWVFTSGWASGINAYAVVLLMGLAERFWHVEGIPEVLGRTDVLVGAAVLFLVDGRRQDPLPRLGLGLGPHRDRPAVGATLGYLFAHEHASLDAAFMAATGGLSALASHLVKASTRVAVNTSPEPASNIVVSTTEDLTVAAVIATAFANPWVAAAIAAVLLVIGATFVVFVLRRFRRVRARYRAWSERRGILATPRASTTPLPRSVGPPTRPPAVGDTQPLPQTRAT